MTIKGPWAFSFGVLSSQILWALKVMDFLQNNYCADARWRVRDLLYPQYFCLEENMWRKEKSCPQNFQQWTYEEERKTFACLLPNSLKSNAIYCFKQFIHTVVIWKHYKIFPGLVLAHPLIHVPVRNSYQWSWFFSDCSDDTLFIHHTTSKRHRAGIARIQIVQKHLISVFVLSKYFNTPFYH